ncbi:MAG: hypothetical protein DRP56_01000 [Planctomycetota bacterium]|nr:MAG: hypothetical protein DRP56_01000 [Planctomycetota bacterium]
MGPAYDWLAEREVFMSANKVSVLFREFLELNPKSDSTEALYRKAIERWIRRLADRDVDSYTVLDAQRFGLFMSRRQINGHPVSPTTVNMYVRCGKAFFNWLVDIEVLEKSPARSLKPLKESRKGHTPYEDGQIEAILRACPDDRWRLIVVLAATAGMRRGEIMNLTVSEIDYQNGSITIRPKKRTPSTWAWSIKDHESRQVPINGLCEQFLLRLHAQLPDYQPYICVPPVRYRYVIGLDRKGKLPHDQRRCPVRNFTRTFKSICQRAGVEYRTFHALRGTCLTVMAENGLQPHELQKIAGHSSVRTTYDHYVRPRQQYLQNARQAAFSGRYRT